MSHKKKLNKIIRRNAEIVQEMLKYPNKCFCREMGELCGEPAGIDFDPDIDWDNPIGVTEPYEYFNILANQYMTTTSKIYRCRKCGKEYVPPILIA